MQNSEITYSSAPVRSGLLLLNAVRNILYILAAFLSFSLWLASTVNTPKRLEELEMRLLRISSAQNNIENRLDLAMEDIRFIKNNLNRKLMEKK